MSNVSLVKRIGVGVRLTEDTAPEILLSMPAEYDWTKRGAVPAAVIAWATADGEEAPKQATGPKGNQTVTDFGRGVNTLSKAVKRLLSGDEDKPVTLRASLSGEGGGSIVIKADQPYTEAVLALFEAGDLYGVLVALIAEGSES